LPLLVIVHGDNYSAGQYTQFTPA